MRARRDRPPCVSAHEPIVRATARKRVRKPTCYGKTKITLALCMHVYILYLTGIHSMLSSDAAPTGARRESLETSGGEPLLVGGRPAVAV